MPMRPKYICPFERLCMFLSIGFLPPTVPFNVVQQTHGILALFHFPMVGAGRGFLLRLASKPWLYLYIRLLLHLFLCQGWNFMKTFGRHLQCCTSNCLKFTSIFAESFLTGVIIHHFLPVMFCG